jgi:alkanesulfonate monooxygenase SsuD/methylene tetrahydromethanopterin reductase-like flavin-dependent oxidoreductase (luciferase family)
LKIGIFTGPQNVGWTELRDVWLHADHARYDSAWTWDHLLALHGDVDDSHFEGWTLLASLATLTEHVRIGHLVTANTLRSPALLAKMAATVDHTSGGRVVVGIGTGYYVEEHARYGFRLPPKAERAEMLTEALQVLQGLWREPRFSFQGLHYRIDDAPAEPKPVQPGGIPILIGGAGGRMLRTAARYADAWNLPDGQYGIDHQRLRAKVEALERCCEEIGRDPGEIEKTMSLTLFVDEDERALRERYDRFKAYRGWDEDTTRRHCVLGTPAQVVEELRRWEALGLDHFMLHLVPGSNYGDLEIFTETVLPHVR